MAQTEVYEYMIRNKGKTFTTKLLVTKMGLSESVARRALRRLAKCKLITRKAIPATAHTHFRYIYKVR